MNVPETNVPDPNLNFFVLYNGEAANELGIAPSTMRQWARAGHIPYVTNHNGWRLFGVGDVYALRDAIRDKNPPT
ncbi:putative site-specific integrase-resolvase [Lipingzhangella halophila]|uniref:Putative site-specific integrase-resolvase n=1 Tax=Lipingzhangella halophila TaxID=1783352 RepID=A0A7W7W5K9_9ACTN|nr:MerR family DNA-binding transcriptional regulator [Lipingzhangella halophila]MBB4934813.1 putative site-specific integrase-resolvase [Lipingzhangella halophila]